MGHCNSCMRVQSAISTAKLILLDGELQEFSCPVKVSHVLQYNNNPISFICNSDEMDFDESVSAIEDDEELQPGNLYFELPVSWLTQPLQAVDMASLAVKASAALTQGGGDKCGCCTKGVDHHQLMFSDEREVKSRRMAVSGGGERVLVEKRRGNGGGGGHKFTRKLSTIMEK
ncbi:unnamed protein product [Ilex paraguariensis]|uniref:Uncharacterized protein n=1 Tax=Ilex paraguariensis TaxID=185542 RepID=A0ABC8T108_9AQUA